MHESSRLCENQAGPGTVAWIGIRPARREPVRSVETVEAVETHGLRGDHFAGKPGSDRQVTLFQHEHLEVVASILGCGPIDPGRLRRNIAVRGINVLSLVERRFRIGAAEFEGVGPCRPCSRMEENLGFGGWNAMRGHGGIVARVVRTGPIRVGDEVVDMSSVPAERQRESSSGS